MTYSFCLAVLLLTSGTAQAAANNSETALLKEFDSLGGNGELLKKANELNPDTTILVVQNRLIDRRGRVEIAPEYMKRDRRRPVRKIPSVWR